jgi:hypothetical protein
MGNPGAIPSNPGPVNIGTWAIPGQSRAIPDLQKLGLLQSLSHHEQARTCKYWNRGNPGDIMSNAGPISIGTWAIREQSRAIPDL